MTDGFVFFILQILIESCVDEFKSLETDGRIALFIDEVAEEASDS